jgi:uncharacterized protein YndB with AHSA1/START domain
MQDQGKLQITTPSDLEVTMTRVFDAPRQMVFDAFTKPEIVKRWMYGPDGWCLDVCEFDLRPGGKLRYEWKNTDNGSKMGLSGEYREVVPPEKLVHTELFDEDWTGGETLVTETFTEQRGKTTVVMTVRYSSQEARDAAMKTGMAEGMEMGYERLDKMFADR